MHVCATQPLLKTYVFCKIFFSLFIISLQSKALQHRSCTYVQPFSHLRCARTWLTFGEQTQHLLPRRGRVARTRIPSVARTCTKISSPSRARTCNTFGANVRAQKSVRTNRSPKGCAYAQHVPFGFTEGEKVRYLFPVPFGERLHIRAPPVTEGAR